MEWIEVLIVGIEALIFLVVMAVLIYLVIKRIDARGKETFEQRDN